MFHINFILYKFSDLSLYCVGTKEAIHLLNHIIHSTKTHLSRKDLSNASFLAKFMLLPKVKVLNLSLNASQSTNN